MRILPSRGEGRGESPTRPGGKMPRILIQATPRDVNRALNYNIYEMEFYYHHTKQFQYLQIMQ